MSAVILRDTPYMPKYFIDLYLSIIHTSIRLRPDSYLGPWVGTFPV